MAHYLIRFEMKNTAQQ